MIVKSSCPACNASKEFYKVLATVKGSHVAVHFAGAPDDSGLPAFVEEIGAQPATLFHDELEQVEAVPLLLKIDSSGTVQRVWPGRLYPETASAIVEDARTADAGR